MKNKVGEQGIKMYKENRAFKEKGENICFLELPTKRHGSESV